MAPTAKTLTYLAQEKTLESSFVRDEEERPKVAYNEFSDEIPVISLAGIDEVDGRRREICEKIVEACENWGIFQVVDHGVDQQLVAEMTRLAKEFFALPPDEKLRFDMSGAKKGGFIVSSHLQGESVQDWREIVTYFSYPKRERDYSRWPDTPEGWRSVTEEYSDKVMGLACKLMEVLSEAMGLEKEGLSKACVDMDQKVVVNYYPKCPQPDLTLGLKRHTDPGTITLLLQDQVGGLQATRDNGKTWITVQPVEAAFVVNLGDHAHLYDDNDCDLKSPLKKPDSASTPSPTACGVKEDFSVLTNDEEEEDVIAGIRNDFTELVASSRTGSSKSARLTVTPNFPDCHLPLQSSTFPLFSPMIVGTQRASLMEQYEKVEKIGSRPRHQRDHRVEEDSPRAGG
ncbi:naringenin,2-oxoglutarate 3-dioxygenase [Glycine max]|uniref:naringenin,2-oxoglutarate 3-dioxygenase n=1 Tax=Glycine max TaxID=3847 RepID=UPI0007191D60|nr:naringenin,2-oxoglutarate 3-dioxygenase [Glycine max]|eukprot:XP_014632702.1 naringenin,2-oxoglutarate 3-dioxygenase [Glycine max]